MSTPLQQADRKLRAHVGSPGTLNPERKEATGFDALGRILRVEEVGTQVSAAFERAITDIIDAQLEHFPETIFWDFDFLAASLVATGEAETIEAIAAEIVALQAQYGRHSAIRFRYVHDFVYGYDWAKWVMGEPTLRGGVGPFDLEFLAYLRGRGRELVALIAADDVKYPKLPDGRPRNPFGFSREPEDEQRLHRSLAEDRLVPVAAWSIAARPSWQQPYGLLREERARALGLPSRGG